MPSADQHQQEENEENEEEERRLEQQALDAHDKDDARIMTMELPLDSLAATASSFASVSGILVERRQTDHSNEHDDDSSKNNKKQSTSYFECAPISLLPNAFPKSAFVQAQTVAPWFNILVEQTSHNLDFLERTLQPVLEADPFTAQLLKLYKQIYFNDNDNDNNKFARQADRLGLFRSDYMLHPSAGGLKQVELNTIAASFGALSTRVAALHRHLTTTSATDEAVQTFLQHNKQAVLKHTGTTTTTTASADGVPENPALERLAHALHVAAQQFETRFQPLQKPIVLFVVQPGETNTVDQRLLEFQLTQAHGWTVVRKSLSELAQIAKVDSETGLLTLVETNNNNSKTTSQTVAVVYYRAGYAPTDYFGESEWKARTILEQSVATKSPSLGYHLVGTKKVQQALARPGVLESLLQPTATVTADQITNEAIPALRAVFAGLYTLGPDMVEDDYRAVQDILVHGQDSKYVLKPQREGGGYNFYGKQMEERLRLHITDLDKPSPTVDHSVLGEFILMERLFPPEQRAVLLRSGQVEGSGPSISELGCFGTIVTSHDGTVVHNEYAGFLLRTKFSHVDEGGVAAGFATLSSPYLVE